MKENILEIKSYAFSLKIVELYKHLTKQKKEYVISKQVLRSGTSIGANIVEALAGQSRKDFYAKLCISFKECKETHYWIILLKEGGFISEAEADLLLKDAGELARILGKIKSTVKASI